MARKYRVLGYMMALGGEIGFLVGGGAALGVWIDVSYATTPWFTLLALGVGIVAAAVRMVQYLRLIRRSESDD